MVDELLKVAVVVEPAFELFLVKYELYPERIVLPHVTEREMIDEEPSQLTLTTLRESPAKLSRQENMTAPVWRVSLSILEEMDNTNLLWMTDLESSLFECLSDNALFRGLSISEPAAGDKPFALAEETLRLLQQ